MKNIKFLVLVLSLIALRINAYEYLVYENLNGDSVQRTERFYVDNSGKLYLKDIHLNGSITYTNNIASFYNVLGGIKSKLSNYISKENFDSYFINDINFLNDLYVYSTNPFLNYLYNNDRFSQGSNINYNDYQILYNDQGFAVASNVNGKWAGLYDNETIKTSGNLYNKKGMVEYKNGKYVGMYNNIAGFDIISTIINNISQGFKLVCGLGIGLFICIMAFGACLKWINYKNGLYSNGIKQDAKRIREIKQEANVLAWRTVTGLGEKTPDEKWNVLLKDHKDKNNMTPEEREFSYQYHKAYERAASSRSQFFKK